MFLKNTSASASRNERRADMGSSSWIVEESDELSCHGKEGFVADINHFYDTILEGKAEAVAE